MKNSKITFIIAWLFIAVLLTASCSSNNNNTTDKTGEKVEKTIDKKSKEYASAYICPMHCEGSGGDAEGKCPVCEMDYVKNPDATVHEEDHDHDHPH